MLDLSPTKIIIVLVVAVILLGPKRLPRVARELGAGWRKLRELHGRVDSELRESMPDLPSTQEIVHFARSPITMLNRLATLDAPDDAVPYGGPGAADDDGGELEEGEGEGDGAFTDEAFTDAAFTDEAFTDAAFTDATSAHTDPGDAPEAAGRREGRPDPAREAPRLVSLAPLPPSSPTDDPHLN